MRRMAMAILLAALLPGCGPSAATCRGAHDLAVALPAIFERGDAADRAAACRLARAIDAALNGGAPVTTTATPY